MHAEFGTNQISFAGVLYINKPIVFRFDHFSANARSLRQFTVHNRWSIAIALFLLRSLFPTNDDNNSNNDNNNNNSNQLTKLHNLLQNIVFDS